MAATLPLTGDGNISMNNGTPADGLFKLTDRATAGGGYNLTIEGSDASGTNQNGGRIVLIPGANTGTGRPGYVDVLPTGAVKGDWSVTGYNSPVALVSTAGQTGSGHGVSTEGPVLQTEYHSSISNADTAFSGANNMLLEINSDHDRNIHGLLVNMVDNHPGFGDHHALALYSGALADQYRNGTPAPQTNSYGAMYGAYVSLNNRNHDCNGVGIEIAACNSDATNDNYLDTSALDTNPTRLMCGMVVNFDPSGATRHATRGIWLQDGLHHYNCITSIAAAPTNGGSGYTLNDILTVDEGVGGSVRVTGVNAGVVTTVAPNQGGESYTTGTGKTTTGGTGSGCTISITGVSSTITAINSTPVNGGTGYTLNDVLTVLDDVGGGNNATIRVSGVSGGVVTSVTLVSGGWNYVPGSNKRTSGGTGSGCEIEITGVADSTDTQHLGYDTGINLQNFVDTGMFINTKVQWQDPEPGARNTTAQKVGLRFGPDLTDLIQIRDSTNSDKWGIYTPSDRSYLSFRIDPRGSVVYGLSIRNDGSVAIGSTTVDAGSKLDVNGNVNLSGGSDAILKVGLKDVSNNSALYLKGAGTTGHYIVATGTGTSSIGFLIAQYGGTWNDNQVRIYHDGTVGNISTPSGNLIFSPAGGSIGVGTSNPGSKLEVNGGGTAPAIIQALGGNSQIGGFKVGRASADGTFAVAANAGDWIAGSAAGDVIIRTESTNKLFLDSGTSNVGIVISDGNVGIGTTSPGEKLEVNGDIKFGSQGVKISTGTVDPSGGTDGDLYIRKNGANTKLCINVNGTWKKCTLEAL